MNRFLKNIYLEKYKFLNIIHSGGFSDVYKAVDLKTNKKVIIKNIFDYKEAIREAYNLTNVVYIPCCQKIIGYKIKNDTRLSYVITDYYQEGELLDYINSENFPDFINENEFTMELYRILRPLYHLHDKGYAHLDIKPDNFIFQDEFKLKTKYYSKDLYLIDFLTCRKADLNLNNSIGINKYNFSSTYTPPEICYDNKYNINSDMWGVGLLSYNLLFKEQPLINMQNKTFTLLHTNSIKRDIEELGFSSNLTKLITNCFELDPLKRTTSKELYHSIFN